MWDFIYSLGKWCQMKNLIANIDVRRISMRNLTYWIGNFEKIHEKLKLKYFVPGAFQKPSLGKNVKFKLWNILNCFEQEGETFPNFPNFLTYDAQN